MLFGAFLDEELSLHNVFKIVADHLLSLCNVRSLQVYKWPPGFLPGNAWWFPGDVSAN